MIGDSCVISAACDYDSWVISAMGYGKQYEATVCVVQESMRWKSNQIRDITTLTKINH